MPDPRLDLWRERIDAALARSLDLTDSPPQLGAAMRHAVLLGGKRMRPLLVVATGAIYDASEPALLAAGAAVELIHAYSLVHDDLPAMDDDALRRGQPTVHVAWDEATAIIAGDALQALAFELLAAAPVPAEVAIGLVRALAGAAGASGMCGGQSLDVLATGKSAATAVGDLERLHALKTGALIRAAVRMGGLCGDAGVDDLARLDEFAGALGLAFQVRDDILDVEADTAQLGKTAGKDADQDKATFPALLGMEASKARLADLSSRMTAVLQPFGERADALRGLAAYAVERHH